MPRSPITIKINGAPDRKQRFLVREDVDMARSRRALVRKGNVASIAEARQKRDAQRQAESDAQSNMRISTLDEETRKLNTVQSNRRMCPQLKLRTLLITMLK